MHLWCDLLLVPAEVRLQGWGPVDLVVALAHDTPVFPVQVLVTAPARVHRRGLSRKTNFLIGLISFFHLILYPKHSRTTYRSASSSPAFTCHRTWQDGLLCPLNGAQSSSPHHPGARHPPPLPPLCLLLLSAASSIHSSSSPRDHRCMVRQCAQHHTVRPRTWHRRRRHTRREGTHLR